MGKRPLLTERGDHSVSPAENLHQIWTIAYRTRNREVERIAKTSNRMIYWSPT